MIKKQLLLLLFIFGYTTNAHGMHLQQMLGQGLSDFGILRNPSKDDEESYQAYLQGSIPIVLVADKYDKKKKMSSFVQEINAQSTKLVSAIKSLPTDSSKIAMIALVGRYYELFDTIRQLGVVCSARGSFIARDIESFTNVMTILVSSVLEAGWEAGLQSGSEAPKPILKKAKDNEDKWLSKWAEQYRENGTLTSELDKLKKELAEKLAALHVAAYEIARKDSVLIECAYAIGNLEDENKDLKAKSARQESVALEVAKGAIELEERNEELQAERDRSRQEKTTLIKRYEKQIEDAASLVTHRQMQSGNALMLLRKEISPLRRDLVSLRGQVTAQEIELREKDAEITRLKKKLVMMKCANARIRSSKKISRLEVLKKATKR